MSSSTSSATQSDQYDMVSVARIAPLHSMLEKDAYFVKQNGVLTKPYAMPVMFSERDTIEIKVVTSKLSGTGEPISYHKKFKYNKASTTEGNRLESLSTLQIRNENSWTGRTETGEPVSLSKRAEKVLNYLLSNLKVAFKPTTMEAQMLDQNTKQNLSRDYILLPISERSRYGINAAVLHSSAPIDMEFVINSYNTVHKAKRGKINIDELEKQLLPPITLYETAMKSGNEEFMRRIAAKYPNLQATDFKTDPETNKYLEI